MEKVYADIKPVKNIAFEKDLVYVYSNIQKENIILADESIKEVFSYNEEQYTNEEYSKKIIMESEALKDELSATQLALCEIYEVLNG